MIWTFKQIQGVRRRHNLIYTSPNMLRVAILFTANVSPAQLGREEEGGREGGRRVAAAAVTTAVPKPQNIDYHLLRKH